MKAAVFLVALISAYAATASSDPPVSRTQDDDPDPAYDARVTFARLRYKASADPGFGMGGGFNREPPWRHDYPRAERNLMHIIEEVTTVLPMADASRIIDVGDSALFKYPIAYMAEPGFWTMTEPEVENLRNYLLKGGFLIFDDFGGSQWTNFATQMSRVLPQGRWIKLTPAHPIFHAFFEIATFDNLQPSYRGYPEFYGLFEGNDPGKRLMAIANYNNDIGENWEWSDSGFLPVDVSNEAYRFGVNYMVYALTH